MSEKKKSPFWQQLLGAAGGMLIALAAYEVYAVGPGAFQALVSPPMTGITLSLGPAGTSDASASSSGITVIAPFAGAMKAVVPLRAFSSNASSGTSSASASGSGNVVDDGTTAREPIPPRDVVIPREEHRQTMVSARMQSQKLPDSGFGLDILLTAALGIVVGRKATIMR